MEGMGECREPSEERIPDGSLHAIDLGGAEVSSRRCRPKRLHRHGVFVLYLGPRFDLALPLGESAFLVFEDGELQFTLSKGPGSITLGELVRQLARRDPVLAGTTRLGWCDGDVLLDFEQSH